MKPRGHEPVSGRRTFPISQIRVAAGCAIAEGKAVVVADQHVLVITAHPITRIAPNVEGDGWMLDADDLDTKE